MSEDNKKVHPAGWIGKRTAEIKRQWKLEDEEKGEKSAFTHKDAVDVATRDYYVEFKSMTEDDAFKLIDEKNKKRAENRANNSLDALDDDQYSLYCDFKDEKNRLMRDLAVKYHQRLPSQVSAPKFTRVDAFNALRNLPAEEPIPSYLTVWNGAFQQAKSVPGRRRKR